MFEDLARKTALVTGAFGGLGRHFALTLARQGMKVGLCGRRVEEGEKLAAQIRTAGTGQLALSFPRANLL